PAAGAALGALQRFAAAVQGDEHGQAFVRSVLRNHDDHVHAAERRLAERPGELPRGDAARGHGECGGGGGGGPPPAARPPRGGGATAGTAADGWWNGWPGGSSRREQASAGKK